MKTKARIGGLLFSSSCKNIDTAVNI